MKTKKGYRKFAVLSEAKWDNTCRLREEGFQKALMEYPDAQILTEARSMHTTSDIKENIKSIMQAYPDLDCFFLAGTKTIGGTEQVLTTIQAMRSTSRISLIAIDFSDKIVDDFHTGILKSAYGTMQLSLDPYYLAILMINTLKGYPLEDLVPRRGVHRPGHGIHGESPPADPRGGGKHPLQLDAELPVYVHRICEDV